MFFTWNKNKLAKLRDAIVSQLKLFNCLRELWLAQNVWKKVEVRSPFNHFLVRYMVILWEPFCPNYLNFLQICTELPFLQIYWCHFLLHCHLHHCAAALSAKWQKDKKTKIQKTKKQKDKKTKRQKDKKTSVAPVHKMHKVWCSALHKSSPYWNASSM